MKFEIQKILEFHDLFPKENDLDVVKVLKKYDRLIIVKVVAVLGHSYGNAFIPDPNSTFFSEGSKGYVEDLNLRIEKVFRKYNIKKICYSTIHTSLELMRIAFSIPVGDYQNKGKAENVEYDLFRVILMLNERLVVFSKDDAFPMDEILYFNQFATNDANNIDISQIYRAQTYYVNELFNYLSKEQEELLHSFLGKWKLEHYEDYVRSIMFLFVLYESEKKQNRKGCPMLDLNTLKWKDNLFESQIADNLAIGVDEHIPYYSEDASNRDNNVDYRCFRSKPLVKVAKGQYYIYNVQLLIERIYNSLFFDLKDLWKKNNFFSYYNKDFVEQVLFRNTMKLCVRNDAWHLSYPTLKMIEDKVVEETDNQPDFYVRQGGSLVLFECKAFKINGELKDKGDADELIKILKNKIYLSEKTLSKDRHKKTKPDRVGVTQLIKEMELIEDNEFEWDKNIPDAVDYYPIIVLEDPKIVQPGLMSMVNGWTSDIMEEKLPGTICYPFIVMSIDTLFLYSEIFKHDGFPKIIQWFVRVNATVDKKTGRWIVNPEADFNTYMQEHYKVSKVKVNTLMDILKSMLRNNADKSDS